MDPIRELGLNPSAGSSALASSPLSAEERQKLQLYINLKLVSSGQPSCGTGETAGFIDIAHDLLLSYRDLRHPEMGGAEIIIHNAAFDVGFLDAELALIGRPGIGTVCPVTDTLAMAREIHPGKRNSLDALCERYQVDNSRRSLHGALLDAQLLADVWLAMTRGQDTLDISLASEVALGALQTDTAYDCTEGTFDGERGGVLCTRNPVVNANVAFNDVPCDASGTGHLRAAFVAQLGFEGPIRLATCRYTSATDAPPTPERFDVVVEDASSPDIRPVSGVRVSISAIRAIAD